MAHVFSPTLNLDNRILTSGGYPDGTYRPAGVVTRDQMAVFVQRAFALPL